MIFWRVPGGYTRYTSYYGVIRTSHPLQVGRFLPPKMQAEMKVKKSAKVAAKSIRGCDSYSSTT